MLGHLRYDYTKRNALTGDASPMRALWKANGSPLAEADASITLSRFYVKFLHEFEGLQPILLDDVVDFLGYLAHDRNFDEDFTTVEEEPIL